MVANAISAVTASAEATIQKSVLGNVGISSQSIIQPLELILTMYISVGLSGGAVSLISPALGSNDLAQAQKYLMHFMFIYFIVILLVPLSTLPWMHKIVVLLGAPEGSQMAELATQYGYVVFGCTTITNFINYGFGNILRATSRSVFNAVKQIVTASTQLLFIFLFYKFIVAKGHVQLYVNGVANFAANFLTGVVVVLMFTPFKKLFSTFKLKFSHRGWRPLDWRALAEICYYAIPDWLAQFQGPIILMTANHILAGISHSISQNEWNITVLGIVSKMSPLISISNMAFSYAFGPSFGYALGAKNWGRVKECMRHTFWWQTGTGMLFWLVMNLSVEAFSKALMQGYQAMADDVAFGFRCYNAFLPLQSCFMCVNDINQMEQKPFKALVVQLSKVFFVIVFEYAFGALSNSYKTVYFAFLAGDLVPCVIGMVNFVERYRTYDKLEKGLITTVQAGIGEITGDKVRCIRRKQVIKPQKMEDITQKNSEEQLQ